MANWEERDEQSWKKRDEPRWENCDEQGWRGSGWCGSGEQGGSGSSSSMQGWSAPPLALPPAPPGHPAGPPRSCSLQEAYMHGHTAGFSQGYRSGFEDGAKRGRPEPTAETDQSAAGSSKKKSKKASQKGERWKVWRETYTHFDEDKATEPYYYTRTGSASTAVYPAEIQEKLRLAAVDTKYISQDVEYDMTDGWVYKIRLFSDEAKPDWNEQLAKIVTAEDGEVVGAQWNSTKALHEPGPGCFEEEVKYRPIFLRNPKEVVV